MWTVIGLFVCWVTVLALHIINHTTNKAGRKNTFAVHERKRTFYFTSEKAFLRSEREKFDTAVEISCLYFANDSGRVKPVIAEKSIITTSTNELKIAVNFMNTL